MAGGAGLPGGLPEEFGPDGGSGCGGAHHARRIADALRTVAETPGLTAYEIAGRMAWSIRCRNWTEFPLTQKFFAVGEALAHLDYLEARGQIHCRETAGKRVYFAGAGDKI